MTHGGTLRPCAKEERKARGIGPQRLTNLHVAGSRCSQPIEVVRALGAMQAQDYAGALWAVGLRVPGATLADVERAVARAQIVRSWPMRGTLHFVAADELGFMLDLLSERVQKAAARRQEGLGLDAATFRKVEKLLTEELAHGARTRDALRDAFTRSKQTFLLPGFDEYILGYADRSAILDPAHASQLVPGDNGVFCPTIVHGGRVLGTWKADAARSSLRVTATDFTPSTPPRQRAFARAASAYAAFLGKPLV